MTRRRWYILLAGCLALMVALGVGGWLVFRGGSTSVVTLAKANHIQPGMTEAEVEGILGPRPRHRRRGTSRHRSVGKARP